MLELTTAVRTLYQRPDAFIISATQQAVPRISINLLTRSITMHQGEAQDAQGRFSWKILRKHISRGPHANKPLAGVDDLTHWNYWRREPLVYKCGLLQNLAPGLVAPRLGNLITLPGDGGMLLDLEWVEGEPASQWPLARFAHVARAVGQWQGRYLVDPLPSYSWLCRRSLAQSLPSEATNATEASSWAGLATLGPLPGLEEESALWQARYALCAALEASPQTLCHADLWGANLLWRNQEAVLFDWSALGIGAFAQDLANLVFDSIWMMQTPASALAELEASVLNAYCDGLREAGFAGDDAWVRRAFATFTALQFGLLSRSLLAVWQSTRKQQNLEARFHRPWREVLSARLVVVHRALALSAQLT